MFVEDNNNHLRNSGKEKVNFLKDQGNAGPHAIRKLGVQDLFHNAAFILDIDLHFKSTDSGRFLLGVNDSGFVCRSCCLQMLHSFVLVSRYWFHYHFHLWKLFLDGGLQMLCECLILAFIVLGRSVVVFAVHTKYILYSAILTNAQSTPSPVHPGLR